MNNKISKDAKLLIISDLIYILISVFTNTFLVAYFLTITNDNIAAIALYYIVLYALHGIGINFMEKFIKTRAKENTKVMSLGIIARALFIFLLVMLKENIAKYYIAIAVIYAFSEVMYWSSHEVILLNVTNLDNRKNYMSINKILSKLTSIFTPIVLGTSISLYSFTKIAVYVFVISIVQIVISLLINPNVENHKADKYSLKKLISLIKTADMTNIKMFAKSSVIYGIFQASISTIIVIITMMTFKSSFKLGVLTTVFSIISIITLFIHNKLKSSKSFLIVSSFLILLGVIGLLFDINKITLIIYNFCYAISISIYELVYGLIKGNLVEKYKILDYKEEYISYIAIFYAIGRVTGFILLLLTSLVFKIIYFKILLAIITIFAPIYAYMVIKIEKNLSNISNNS